MMSLWDALRMNMMISYQELVRTFLKSSMSLVGLFFSIWLMGVFILFNEFIFIHVILSITARISALLPSGKLFPHGI